MFTVELATVQPGAQPFRAGNVNDTFKGLVRVGSSLRGAIIKDLDSRQLANELVVATLAKDYGLPVPDCYLAVVPKGVLSVSKGPTISSGEHLTFASADMQTPNLAQRISADPTLQSAIYDELKKWNSLGGLYAFDTWVANIDRHQGNLLFEGIGKVWLIDHGHCLTGPNWNPGSLVPDAVVHNQLKDWMTPHLTEAEKKKRSEESERLAALLSSFLPSEVISRSRTAEILGDPDTRAAGSFLSRRIPHVVRYANDALDYASLV